MLNYEYFQMIPFPLRIPIAVHGLLLAKYVGRSTNKTDIMVIHQVACIFRVWLWTDSGPGSVVGIATAYGLDGPEIVSP